MIANDKTIYFVLGDLDTPELPVAPQSDDAKRSLLQAYVWLFKDLLGEAAKSVTDETINALTAQQLKELAATIGERMAAEPELAAQYAKINDYEQIALKWKEFAIASGSSDANQVAAYCDAVVSQKQEAIGLLQQAQVDSTSTFKAAKLLGMGAGNIMLALEVAEAVQNSETDPDALFSGLAGIALGSVAGSLLLTALGGVGALLAMPVGAAVTLGLTVVAAAYAAGKLGEFIWEEFISDNFWEVLDEMGIRDNVEQFISMVGHAVGVVVPGDPDSLPYEVVKEFGGEVIASNEKDNIVVGNDARNEIVMLHGRTVAFGKGGDDIYRVHTTARGNQIISDADGENTIIFGIEDIGSLGLKKIGDDVYRSEGGNYTLTRVGDGDNASLVIASKYYEATVTILGWVNGDFGIELPGEPEPYQPPEPSNIWGADANYINPSLTAPPTGGISVDGGGSRDMIWGTGGEFEDVLVGGEGEDIVNGNGGKDNIDGGSDDDFISGFGDESIVHGGSGNDVIAADYSYGWNFNANGNIPIDERGIWKDLQQYFNWQQPTAFSLDEDGTLQLYPGIDLLGNFDHSGPSVIGGGWTYRFWRTSQSSYRLMYFPPGSSDGEDGTSGVITFGNAGHEFLNGVSLYGDAGNDTIRGSSGSDFIDGGEDNDQIVGGAGNDVIAGGTGNDVLAGGTENDIIDGGDGTDTINGEAGSDVITGGAGNDILWGDTHASYSTTEGGDDFIDGGAGDDQISGQAGNDLIAGGDGNDLAIGGEGDDRLLGGQGVDELQGGAGNDSLDGGAENDSLFGEAGSDSLFGGAGVDQLVGGDGNDQLDGGIDNDLIFGQAGNDVMIGGAGDDELQGGADDDSLDGGIGNDKLWGDIGNDRLSSGDGADQLQGGDGADSLDGGDGDDRLWGDAGNDTLQGGYGLDQIAGGDGDDRLVGGDNEDILNGNSGNDQLLGGAGNDNLSGNADNDSVDGGDGDDYVGGDEGNDQLFGGAGNDNLFGGSGADVLTGDAGNDYIDGGAGDDIYVFARGFGSDQVVGLGLGGSGSDTIRFASDIDASDLIYTAEGENLVIALADSDDILVAYGFFVPDATARLELSDGSIITQAELRQMLGLGTPIFGTPGNDTINGTEGSDNLYGGDGHDTLYGLSGDDYVNGGAGNDVIYGSVGDDTLEGGTGNDTYHFAPGFGGDTILGLGLSSSGADTIMLGAGISPTNVQLSVQGNDVTLAIHYGGNPPGFDTLTLQGFLSTTNGMHAIQFADGTRWTAASFANNSLPPWNGTDGDDVRDGTSGNDTLNGLQGNDILSGLQGHDQLNGGAGNDTLHGGDGNDSLRGGEGIDAGYGGAGDDAYRNVEQIHESQDGGIDTLYVGELDDGTYGSGTLMDNVENIVSTTYYYQTLRTLVGNSLDNRMIMRNGGNMLIYAGSMNGGAGADYYEYDSGTTQRYVTIYVDNANDTWKAYGKAQFDLRSYLTSDFSFDSAIKEFTSLGFGAFNVYGDINNNIIRTNQNTAANTLIGGSGDDEYIIGANDVVIEQTGGGNDKVTVNGTGASYVLVDGVETFVIDSRIAEVMGDASDNNITGTGTSAQTIFGLAGNDWIRAGGGNDVLNGGTGADYMEGNYGNDTYYVDDVLDRVFEADYRMGYGDKVISTIDFVLPDGVENLELHDSAIRGTGNLGNNRILGNELDNIIDTGAVQPLGQDTADGGLGSDTYLYHLGDLDEYITEAVNVVGEDDVLQFGAGITMADVSFRLVTNEWGEYLVGRFFDPYQTEIQIARDAGGNSVVELVRFDDGSTYRIDDLVTANAPPQIGTPIPALDCVEDTYFSYTLPADTFINEPGEPLTYTTTYMPSWLSFDPSTLTISGTAPDGEMSTSFSITAWDSWDQQVAAGVTIDVLNRVIGGSGNDTLSGTSGRDALFGYEGNDTLNGGGGADRLIGGGGSDTYSVNNIGDEVIELSGEGDDLINSSVSYSLSDQVERLTLTGSDSTTATGNAMANTLSGNSASNELIGLGGNDILDGKGGTDTLHGGMGNDGYVVDNVGDAIVELASEGVDTVSSSVTYTLSANIENLTLTGSSAINGTGNAGGNTLNGNSAVNVLTGLAGADLLDGKGGADTMTGGLGDDTYMVNASGDLTQEAVGEGVDSVRASVGWTLSANVENLELLGTGNTTGTGNALDNLLVGNDGNNGLNGQVGDDVLEGKLGSDTLTGGAGSDLYLMARGYGFDTLVENDATAGVQDVARFLSGVGYDQLWFKRPSSSNNLEISIIGTTDKLVIKDWYLGGQYRVEEIRTDDGNKLLYAADVQALVNAMAGMTPPAQGQTTLSASQRAALDPVFASTWRDQPAGMQMVSSGQPAIPVSDSASTMETANGRVPVMAGGLRPEEYAWMEGVSLTPVDSPIGDPPPVPTILVPPPNGFGSDLSSVTKPTETLRRPRRHFDSAHMAEPWQPASMRRPAGLLKADGVNSALRRDLDLSMELNGLKSQGNEVQGLISAMAAYSAGNDGAATFEIREAIRYNALVMTVPL